jgi:3-methyladenine DNA glycosylase AlkD
MEAYLAPLVIEMQSAANFEKAIGAKRYMKNLFEHLGTDAKTRRKIMNTFIKEHGLPDSLKLKEFTFVLWEKPEREYQYIAIDVLQKLTKKLRETDIEWIEELITRKSWWDTVDGLAVSICGPYFQLYPKKIIPATERWMQSGNIWLQRSALLYQLKYKKNTDTAIMAKFIEHLAGHREFFIRKAIGWVLREYSKTNKEWVRGFVDSHVLSPLSYKEATKYL